MKLATVVPLQALRPRESAPIVALSTRRIESLCDGVFAIAMTLLVLEIRLPTSTEGGIFEFLRQLWPSFVAYVASFAVLGVYWVSQHTQFHYVHRADHVLIWTTLGLLMLIAAVPFSASLLSHFDFARWTVIFYGSHLIAIGSTQHFIWRYVSRHRRLLAPHADPKTIRILRRVSATPILVYAIAVGFAYVNPYVSVIVFAVVPIVLIVRAMMPTHRGGNG